MVEVSKEEYAKAFPEVYEWFRANVHHNSDWYIYEVRENEKSHLVVIDIISLVSKKAHFRIIIKITRSDVKQPFKPKKDFRELTLFNSTEPLGLINGQTAPQVCYIQIDETDKPIDGVLYAYVEKPSEQFVRFDL